MLVVISDLHLTDGAAGGALSPGAFSLFTQRLKELAFFASWRSDGAYRPVERIDLVLLGDIFDLLRSIHWRVKPAIRPWGDPHAAEMIEQIAQITNGILVHNQRALSSLRALATGGAIALPPSSQAGRRAAQAEEQPIPVRIHYMVGNHDWFYHLPGNAYDAIRQTLVEQLGLANRPDRPFPHDIAESEELLQTMRRHKTTARHGDIFDPLSFEGDRESSSLGDALTIDLVGRFAAEVEASMGDFLPVTTLLEIRDLDHVRPLLFIPVWMEGMLERTCPAPAMRKRVKTLWDRLADEFLGGDFLGQREHGRSAELIDGLALALKFAKRASAAWSGEVAQWLRKVRGTIGDSYYPHALGEADFRNRRAKHVVYGHTHAAECVPLDASYAEGYVLDQMYFNAGTWRRIYAQTRFAPAEREFIAAEAMTYLAFFQGDERGGRPYETWSGTLGHSPAEMIVHRIDPGRSRHGAGQAVPPPGVSFHAPHFAAFPGQTGGLPARRF